MIAILIAFMMFFDFLLAMLVVCSAVIVAIEASDNTINGNFLVGVFQGLLALGLLIIGICLFAFMFHIPTALMSTQQEITEYDNISTRLEANPFDKEAIHDAIVYNHKIEMASELDSLGSENEYEEYLNEPKVTVTTYQINYIQDNFDLGYLLELIPTS